MDVCAEKEDFRFKDRASRSFLGEQLSFFFGGGKGLRLDSFNSP